MDGRRVTGPEAARRLLASRSLRRLGAVGGAGEIFLTGGSLRDRLLGLTTHDFDVAVTGDPRRAAEALAGVVGGRCFALGRPPRTTWRVAGGTLQVDVWGIAAGVEHDILRRDFTVNALFWRLPRGPLLDLVGGLDDLAAGRIRVVRPGNLADDPLRVLRGVRLLATHPRLRLTSETERTLADTADLVARAARERVCDELRRLLAGPAAARALATGARLGILAAILPGWGDRAAAEAAARLAGELHRIRFARPGRLARGAAEAAAAVLAAPAAGAPATWQPEPAVAALDGIGWPRRAARRACEAAEAGERLGRAVGRSPSAARECAGEAGDLVEPAVAWAAARGLVSDSTARALLAWQRRFAGRKELLEGDEIAERLGLPPGPARSAAVAALRRARARGEVRTRAQALAFLARGPVR